MAFSETVRVLRPGGHFCHTTCFINQRHEAPGDYWRFTPKALALLTTMSGCQVVLNGGWGNRQVWALFDAGFRFTKVPDDVDHPFHKLAVTNHPKWPIMTWVVGKKPSIDERNIKA